MGGKNSEIKNFFKNQTIFLTGGTGFVGKIILEKLLRECDDFARIYVLARPKKNKTAEQRFETLFDYPCFEKIRHKKETLEKVQLVNGDCLKPFIGLNEQSAVILINETTCIIHAAANVKFDQSLKEAAGYVRACGDILELAKQMKNLKAFVYISTAFSNCIHTDIKEEFYKPPIKPEHFLSLVNDLDEDILVKITPSLLEKWPNTYVYSKAISEALIKSVGKDLPISIVRPAIVTHSAKEPISGWVENFYGMSGIGLASGLGVLNSLHAEPDAPAPFVPVDCVANCILAVASKTAHNNSTTIYNYFGTSKNQITYREVFDYIYSFVFVIPAMKSLWYYNLRLQSNKLLHKISIVLYHTIPAYFVDFIFFCMGKPTIAVKSYQRLDEAMDSLSFFTTRSWLFHDDNLRSLWNELLEEDRKLFNFNLEELAWKEYMFSACFGTRTFLLKDPQETILAAKRKMVMLCFVFYAFRVMRWYLLYKFIMYILGLIFEI